MTPFDAERFRHARQGNTEASCILLDRHSPRLSRYALHQLANRTDAAEAVQQAFVHAFRSLARSEKFESPEAASLF